MSEERIRHYEIILNCELCSDRYDPWVYSWARKIERLISFDGKYEWTDDERKAWNCLLTNEWCARDFHEVADYPELFFAIRSPRILTQLIDEGYNVNAMWVDGYGYNRSVLDKAVCEIYKGNAKVDVIEILLEEGIDFDVLYTCSRARRTFSPIQRASDLWNDREILRRERVKYLGNLYNDEDVIAKLKMVIQLLVDANCKLEEDDAYDDRIRWALVDNFKRRETARSVLEKQAFDFADVEVETILDFAFIPTA